MENINNDFNLENMNINSNDNNLSATLKQGIQFKKYQHKIVTNKQTEEIAFDLEKSDTSHVTGFNKLSDGPSNIIEGFEGQTSTPVDQMVQLGILQSQYNELVRQLNTEKQNLITGTNNYIDGISTTNPYLGKNITTKSDGKSYYITGEGVAKLYPSSTIYNEIIGKNNCPKTTEEIDSIPSYINTTNGTPMVVGQQCGKEGKNVFVKNVITDTGDTYIGCYNDSLESPAMTSVNNGSQDFTFQTCKQAAIDTGNLYFGLQNLNPTTKKSSCFVSNDYDKTTQYKKSTPDTIPCQPDSSDNYIYGGKSVNAIYKTPDATYLGLFPKNKESRPPAMKLLNSGTQTFTYNTCKLAAKNANMKYFGLENFNKKTNKSSCSVGNDISKILYNIDAGSTSYITGPIDKKKYGNNTNRTVYQVDSEKSYYNGCYNDNKTSPAMTPVGEGASTYSYYTCQEEAIKSGKKYFALQGGKNGTSKCFVSDDLTTAQKYGPYQACMDVNSDGGTYKYGANEINALYKMNSAGVPSNVGKMGYVDGNDTLMEYPSTMISPGTNYTKYDGYDIINKNLKTIKTISNTTFTACIDECNKSNEYYGFVFDNSTNPSNGNGTGYLMGPDILNPSLKVHNPNTNLYIRDLKMNGMDASCNRSIESIDSNQWKNYSKGANMTSQTKCSLTKAISGQNNKIMELQNKITQVGGEIIIILNNLKKQTDDVKSKIGINSDKIDSDLVMYNKTINDIQNYKNSEDNMNNIVKDTNLLVLYQNYNYMFWSILAISTMIISMKVMGK
uniref:Uncharacterized protein n=1 Tax=viral metagenome TaxID=1070528 RepID=A0A6C0DDD2_9ZZZZ